MKRIRIVGLCLTVMVMFGAVAAASAAAHGFKVAGKELTGTESAEVAGVSETSELVGEVASTKLTILCGRDATSGTAGVNMIEAGGKTKGEITFEKCGVLKVPLCTVPNIKFKFTDLLVGTEPVVEDEFKPTGAEEVFVEIKLEGASCTLKGTYKVKGTQTCKLPEATSEVVVHTIECLPSGSAKLTLGGKAATFKSTEKVELKSKKLWSAH